MQTGRLFLIAMIGAALLAGIHEPIQVEAGQITSVPGWGWGIREYLGIPCAAPPVGNLALASASASNPVARCLRRRPAVSRLHAGRSIQPTGSSAEPAYDVTPWPKEACGRTQTASESEERELHRGASRPQVRGECYEEAMV